MSETAYLATPHPRRLTTHGLGRTTIAPLAPAPASTPGTMPPTPTDGDLLAADLAEVDRALADVYADGVARAAAIGPEYAGLWSALARLDRGGKRFRPRLVVGTHRALAGVPPGDAVIQTAAAVELLHTAFIVHDDVIDGDERRRGHATVNGAFADRAHRLGAGQGSATTWATAAGILAGDLALSRAQHLLGCLDAPGSTRRALLDLVQETMFVSAAGELADVTDTLRLDDLPLADAVATASRKTAEYSFVAPLLAGAILAGATPEVLAALRRFGVATGIAFQVVDDILGVLEPRGGKTLRGDLATGKATALVLLARGTPAWGRIRDALGTGDLSEERTAEVRSQLIECGAFERAQELAVDHAARAHAILDESALDERLERFLRPVVDAALARTR